MHVEFWLQSCRLQNLHYSHNLQVVSDANGESERMYALVSDVVEKTSTRRRSRIPCVVVEKITTRRREGVGVVVEKNEESQRTFNKNYYDLLTAVTELLIVHSPSIFRYVITD